MNALYDVVSRRFTHGAASHNVFSNWLLWAEGLKRNPKKLKDTRLLVARGHSALCGQISQLLADLAREMDVRARVLQLSGHVVMEAFYDGAWHMYDADSEVPPSTYDLAPQSLAELLADPLELRRLYQKHNPTIPALMLSINDNYISDLAPEKRRREEFAQVAKYLILALVLLTCLPLIVMTRQNLGQGRTS